MQAVPHLEKGRRGRVGREDAVPTNQHLQVLLHVGMRRGQSSQPGDDPAGRHGEVVGLELHRIFEAEARVLAENLGYPLIAVRGVPFEADLLLLVGIALGEVHLVGARDPAPEQD